MHRSTGLSALGLAIIASLGVAHAATVRVGGTGSPASGNVGNIVLTSAGVDAPQFNSAYFSGPAVIGGQTIASDWVWSFVNGARTRTATYEFAFDLTGFNLSSAVVQGLWGVDNFGSARLNGVEIAALSSEVRGNFSVLNAFGTSLDGLFVQGLNTLSFVVADGSVAPSAFRASVLVTADLNSAEVPIPAAAGLFALGIGALGALRRRQKV